MSEPSLQQTIPAALEFLTATVACVNDEDWDRPSNLDGWTVRDVVAHVTGSVYKLSALIDGVPFSRVRSEPIAWRRPDPVAELRSQASHVLEVLPSARMTDEQQSPMGPVTLADALGFPTVDAVVHAWDIERSCGRNLEVPEDLLAYVRRFVDGIGDLAATPQFDEPVSAPPDATPTQLLMARMGRRSD